MVKYDAPYHVQVVISRMAKSFGNKAPECRGWELLQMSRLKDWDKTAKESAPACEGTGTCVDLANILNQGSKLVSGRHVSG